MKLYKRYSRFKYRKRIPHSLDKIIRWGASLQPGDLINDCSGFNSIVKEVNVECNHSSRGWAIVGVNYDTEPNGGCSLLHCGVEPAIARDVLEVDYVRRHEDGSDVTSNTDWIRHWYGDDKEKADKAIAVVSRRIEAVKSGEHFLDDRGVMLSEFSN